MYIIKPLVWYIPPKRVHFHVAHTIFGDIHIDDHGHDVFVNMIGVLGEESTHKNMDAAKSYAEAWYHNRIREALDVGQSEAATSKYLSDSGSDAGCRCSNLCGTCESRVNQIVRNCVGVNPARRDRVLWSGVITIFLLIQWFITCEVFIKHLGIGVFVSMLIIIVGFLATWIEESIRDFNANATPADDLPQGDEGNIHGDVGGIPGSSQRVGREEANSGTQKSN